MAASEGFIKEQADEISSVKIKQEEGSLICYDGLVDVKQDKEILAPDVGGLLNVKHEVLVLEDERSSEEMARFSTAEDEFLIHYVERHPELYDMERGDYRDMVLKEKVWHEIGTVLKKQGEDCKRRWKNIKDTYFKNKKRMGTGRAAREKIVKWHLFKHLSFLDNVRHERPSANTLMPDKALVDHSDLSELDSQPRLDESPSTSNIYESEQDPANLNQSSSNESSSCFKRPRIRYDAMERRAEERFQIIKKALLEEDDEVDLFMKSIAKSVKVLPPELIEEAKLGILTLVSKLKQRSRGPPYPQND